MQWQDDLFFLFNVWTKPGNLYLLLYLDWIENKDFNLCNKNIQVIYGSKKVWEYSDSLNSKTIKSKNN